MAITLKRARRTLIATAVLWAMGVGVAMAEPPTGNKLVGPVVNATSNATTVNILQVGNGNVISGIGNDAGNSAGTKATINSTGTHAITLTIQQVGDATGGNILTLAAKTAGTALNEIKIFQGASKETNDPADKDTPPVTTGSPNAVTGNTAKITLGNEAGGIQSSTVIVSQQNNYNTATIDFGTNTAATAGTLTLVQTGAANNVSETGNTATLTIDGTASRTYQIAQNGASNTLTLDADGIGAGGVTIKFGTVDFDDGSTWLANAGISSSNNNAASFNHFAGSPSGINLGTIAGFDLSVTGNHNNIQVDLSTANTASSISGLTFNGSTNDTNRTLAIFGGTSDGKSATVSISAVDVNNSNLIVNAGSGVGSISLSSLTLIGNSSFSTTAGSIELGQAGSPATITSATVTQTGDNHYAKLIGSGSWNVTQSGSVADDSEPPVVRKHSITATGTASASWTITQTDKGAKTLEIENKTPSATINISQTGDVTHSATGIVFNAASGSFTLVQR